MPETLTAAEISGRPSHEDLREMVRRALAGNGLTSDVYVVEMSDTDVVVAQGSYRTGTQHFRRTYAVNEAGDGVTLGEPVAVKLSWQDKPVQASEETEEGTLLFSTPLGTLAFGEDDSTEIEVCRDGTWQHEKYGKVTITPAMRERFIQNFSANVRKVGDLPLDFDHKPSPAPGWIKGLENRGKSLFAKVALTPTGKQAIQNGEYRFFSPEWNPAWKDPETGTQHGPTLFGGAFTNKPFFRGMAALQCSEFSESEPDRPAAGPQEKPMPENVNPGGTQTGTEPGGLTAAEAQQMRDEIRTLRAAEERRGLEQTFSEMRFPDPAFPAAGTSRRVITPASRTALVEALMEIPAEHRQKFAAAVQGLQFVQLGELGFSDAEKPDPAQPSEAETKRLLEMTSVGQSALSRK